LHSLEERLALVLVLQLVLGDIGIPGDVMASCVIVMRTPMDVHSSQRRHRKDSDQKKRQEMHSRSRSAGEEKGKRETVKGEGKERKEMKGVRVACRDPYVFITVGNLATAVQAWPRRVSFHQLKKPLTWSAWQPNNERMTVRPRGVINRPFCCGPRPLCPQSHGRPRSPKVSRTKQGFVRVRGSFVDDAEPRILGLAGE